MNLIDGLYARFGGDKACYNRASKLADKFMAKPEVIALNDVLGSLAVDTPLLRTGIVYYYEKYLNVFSPRGIYDGLHIQTGGISWYDISYQFLGHASYLLVKFDSNVAKEVMFLAKMSSAMVGEPDELTLYSEEQSTYKWLRVYDTFAANPSLISYVDNGISPLDYSAIKSFYDNGIDPMIASVIYESKV